MISMDRQALSRTRLRFSCAPNGYPGSEMFLEEADKFPVQDLMKRGAIESGRCGADHRGGGRELG